MKKELLYIFPIAFTAFIGVLAICKPLPEAKPTQTYVFETTTEKETTILEGLNKYVHSKAEEQNAAILETIVVETETETESIAIMEPFKPLDFISISPDVQEEIYNLCGAYEFDFIFFMGWMYAESHCEWKIGASNDTGYMQIIPQYYEEAAKSMGIDIYSELGNCEYALVLLNGFLRDECGDLRRALQRYNTGVADSNNGYTEWVIENVEYIRKRYEEQ